MLNDYILLSLRAQVPKDTGAIEVNYYYNNFILTSDMNTKCLTKYEETLDICKI